MSEHDFEPIRGLPGDLPPGERILWQGAPRWSTLAAQAFHVRAVGLYFAGMFAFRALTEMRAGEAPLAAFQGVLFISPIAVATLAILAGLAWLYTRTTVYTITNKRVVIRFGVAMPKAFNLPFAVIESAALKTLGGDAGDLALTLKAPNKIAFAHLWPNTRPWRFAAPEPTLRALPDAQAAAAVLAAAIAETTALEVTLPDLSTPARAPSRTGVIRPDVVAA